jgi:hypothetical protein
VWVQGRRQRDVAGGAEREARDEAREECGAREARGREAAHEAMRRTRRRGARGGARCGRPPCSTAKQAQHMCTQVHATQRMCAHRAGRQVDGGAEVEVRREESNLVEPGVALWVPRDRELEVVVDGVDVGPVQERGALGGRARRHDGRREEEEERNWRVVADAECSQLRAQGGVVGEMKRSEAKRSGVEWSGVERSEVK